MNNFSDAHNYIRSDEESDFLSEIDFSKILLVFRKSFFWILLILATVFTGAYLYLRYTKPLYESTSRMKLDANEYQKNIQNAYEGFLNVNNDALKQLLGELEFIQSEVISQMVIKKLDLQVSYFTQGNFLDSELYRSSPFRVEVQSLAQNLYNQPLNLRILNQKQYELSYTQGKTEIRKTYRFGQTAQSPDLRLKISLSRPYDPSLEISSYYFVVNREQNLINYLRKNLSVGISNKEARIIEISFTDYNPVKARDIVATTDSVYMTKSVEVKNKSNKQQIAYIDIMLRDYEDSLITYESEIQGFFLENKTKNVDEKLSKSINQLEGLFTKKREITREISLLRELEDLVDQEGDLKDFLPSLGLLDNESISREIREMHKLLEQRERLELSKNVERTYAGKDLSKRVQIAKDDIKILIGASQEILLDQLRNINAEIIEIESSFADLPSKGREISRIQRQYDQLEEYQSALLSKRTELQIKSAGIVPEFSILSPANIPRDPIYPDQLIIYLMAGSLGVFLSLSLVGARYFVHNTFTSQQELEKNAPVPVLGSLPEYRRLKNTRLVVTRNPKASINEALRSIRTNLDFVLPSGKGIFDTNSCTTMLITSTISGEGKTFVAANLAGIIAMSDLKVILLDFDMRKPKLHLTFDAENLHGVSSILIGRQKTQDCIQGSEIKNLDFISSGPTPPNPAELILREDFDLMMEELKKTYDLIIIDTPPVGLVTDAILIMKKVDVSLYVTRADYSKKHFVRNIKRLIQNNNLSNMAVVLNSVRKGGGYGYGYGGYYTGGYYEESPDQLSLWQNIIRRITFKKEDK